MAINNHFSSLENRQNIEYERRTRDNSIDVGKAYLHSILQPTEIDIKDISSIQKNIQELQGKELLIALQYFEYPTIEEYNRKKFAINSTHPYPLKKIIPGKTKVEVIKGILGNIDESINQFPQQLPLEINQNERRWLQFLGHDNKSTFSGIKRIGTAKESDYHTIYANPAIDFGWIKDMPETAEIIEHLENQGKKINKSEKHNIANTINTVQINQEREKIRPNDPMISTNYFNIRSYNKYGEMIKEYIKGKNE